MSRKEIFIFLTKEKMLLYTSPQSVLQHMLSDLGEKEDSDAVWQKYNQVLLIWFFDSQEWMKTKRYENSETDTRQTTWNTEKRKALPQEENYTELGSK